MIKDFTLGINSYIEAWKFLFRKHFWWYALIPLVVFLGIFYLGNVLKDVNYFYLPNKEDGMGISIAYYFLDGIILLIAFALLNFTRYIMLAMVSPVLSIVSQRTEKLLNDKKYGFSFRQILRDVKRALKLISRNLIVEAITILGIIVLFWLVNFFLEDYETILNTVENLLIIIIAFYYYGFSFMDYNLERWKIDEKESVKFVRKHKGLALAIGSVFTPIFHYLNQFISSYSQTTSNDYEFLGIVFLCALISALLPIWSMVASTLAMEKITYLDVNSHKIEENP
tara:strand:- start:469 stop:1317 length:849 start_codon:yes stop_codon:yes gene_type:complete